MSETLTTSTVVPFSEYEIIVGIEKLWREQGHCMRYGSSRETLAHWYNEVNTEWRNNTKVKPQEIRRMLMKLVEAKQCDKAQSNSGHSIFLMKETMETGEIYDKLHDLQSKAREQGFNIESVSYLEGVDSEMGITHQEVGGIKIINK